MKTRRWLALSIVCVACGREPASSAGAVARSSDAITFGELDGERHPNVGALLADWDPGSPGLDALCTGTLVAPTVFLTAAHCTTFLQSLGLSRAFVTFAPSWDEESTGTGGTFAGTLFSHPDFACCGANDPFDLAVVVLDEAPGIDPARLPTAGLLDELKASGELASAVFTAVGYGVVREEKTGGPHPLFFDATRRFALGSFQSLNPAWLNVSMQPSTGNGGTCYGDSGGPHFLGGASSDLLVSITITGDRWCRATDRTYRLDTPAAREFLGEFLTLP